MYANALYVLAPFSLHLKCEILFVQNLDAT